MSDIFDVKVMRTMGLKLEIVLLFPSGCAVFGVVLLEVIDYNRPKTPS